MSSVLDNLYSTVPKRSHAYVSCRALACDSSRLPRSSTRLLAGFTPRQTKPLLHHLQINEHYFGGGANGIAYCESLTSSLVTE